MMFNRSPTRRVIGAATSRSCEPARAKEEGKRRKNLQHPIAAQPHRERLGRRRVTATGRTRTRREKEEKSRYHLGRVPRTRASTRLRRATRKREGGRKKGRKVSAEARSFTTRQAASRISMTCGSSQSAFAARASEEGGRGKKEETSSKHHVKTVRACHPRPHIGTPKHGGSGRQTLGEGKEEK